MVVCEVFGPWFWGCAEWEGKFQLPNNNNNNKPGKKVMDLSLKNMRFGLVQGGVGLLHTPALLCTYSDFSKHRSGLEGFSFLSPTARRKVGHLDCPPERAIETFIDDTGVGKPCNARRQVRR